MTDTADDDPKPLTDEELLHRIKVATVAAELLKPVAAATEELLSPDPDRAKAREAAAAAYAKAASVAPPGKLREDYQRADSDFVRTAADMELRLSGWIAATLDDGKPLSRILKERKAADAAAAAATPSGNKEAARNDAALATRQWAAAYADWSSPQTRIDLKYAADIPKLNADINNDVDQAYSIYRFWFDVAPRHLQLRDQPVTDDNAPGVSTIVAKLATDFPELAARLKSGPERGKGTLYLIDPSHLDEKRKEVRLAWENAAKDQAEAEVRYRETPDDSAALKKRRDELEKKFDEAVRSALPRTPTA